MALSVAVLEEVLLALLVTVVVMIPSLVRVPERIPLFCMPYAVLRILVAVFPLSIADAAMVPVLLFVKEPEIPPVKIPAARAVVLFV